MTPRHVGLVAAICLTAGWTLGSVLSPPTASLQSPEAPAPRPAARQDAAPAPYTERLKLRLDQAPSAPDPVRNPFQFGAARPRPGTAADTGPAVPLAPAGPPPVAAPTGPRFSLAGMAASEVDGATVRTAIVSDGDGLYYVREGESLPDGFTVTRIDEAAILLTDAAGGTLTLTLR
ncbi:MAG: hypothetical protein AB7H88_08470 [Vicinamibacterales bacterium]